MKKKFYTLLFALLAIVALAGILGINEGDEISQEKINATTQIDVSYKSISDLKGIEHFTALTYLYCNYNHLTTLDVSKNRALTNLQCQYNQLSALDVSNNTALTWLYCYSNQLTALDVSNNTALTYLYCSDNPLTALDVSNNTALTTLSCYNNQLTALDVSNNTALTWLYCYSNQLSALDVSNNTALTYLDCSDNPLTALDVSKNTALIVLYCGSNQLTALDVSKNTALTYLSCSKNQLTDLDVSNNTALTRLDCDNNQLTDLDVSNNTALTTLYCYNNRIQGEKMDAFIQTLPVSNGGNIYLIDSFEEGNIINNSQIINAQEKGWNLYYKEYNQWNKIETTGDIPNINDLLGDYTFYYGSSGTNTMDCQLVKTSSGYGLKFTGTPEGIIPVTMSFDNSTMKFKNTQFVGDWKTASVTTDQAIVLLMYTNGTSVYRTRSTTSVGLKGTFSIDPETADVVWTMTGIAPSGRDFYALRVANTSDGTYETITSTISTWINPVKLVKKKKEIVLNEENFPDANFRAALANILGINEGDEISQEKINATTQINVSDKSISDLKGIEHFTALEALYCYYNQLTALDVSKNTALIELLCSDNQLTTLDVSKNTALTSLSCYGNKLTTLDVSKNTALTRLHCFSNQLTALDVSNNTSLTNLQCHYNQLSALDVSNNTALTTLYCYYNQLTALDVSKNTALTSLACYNNQIKGAQMDALVNSLPTISSGEFYVFNSSDNSERNVCTKVQVAIAKSKGWKVYQFNGTAWSEYEGSDEGSGEGVLLNAENFPDANFRAALAGDLGINEGDEISQEKINATTVIDVANKSISDLKGIENFTALEYLFCYNNQLTTLDVSKNTALTTLWCYSNQLTALDVSKNTALTYLDCYNNQLTTLDVSNTALTTLYCSNNQLTALDISKNTTLTQLSCSSNQLTALDVSNNTALTELNCGHNQLTTLDVRKNTALTQLSCGSNQLTALDVSNNTALTELNCGFFNQLTILDVSKNTALTYLDCCFNRLTILDVSKNTALTQLMCFSNKIKGEAMDALIASLPTANNGYFVVINTRDSDEGNVCTKTQVAAAKAKGWTAYDDKPGFPTVYEGSDELILNEDNFTDSNFRATLSQILGISEDDEITPEMIDEITTLNVSNKTISNLKGIEHFKELMVLYCQLNQIKGADMDDLIASLPTIDTSSAAPALNAPRKTSGTWGALYAYDNTASNEGNVITTEQVADANAKGWKVYQFNGTAWEEYAGSTTGITIVENNDDAIANWYTLDGKPLCSKPEKAGMYVVKMSNGKTKKVMVK